MPISRNEFLVKLVVAELMMITQRVQHISFYLHILLPLLQRGEEPRGTSGLHNETMQPVLLLVDHYPLHFDLHLPEGIVVYHSMEEVHPVHILELVGGLGSVLDLFGDSTVSDVVDVALGVPGYLLNSLAG